MTEPYYKFKELKQSFFQHYKKELLQLLKEAKNKNQTLNHYKESFMMPELDFWESKLGMHSGFMKKVDDFIHTDQSMKLPESFDFNFHALPTNLKKHFIDDLAKYEALKDLGKLWNHKYFTYIGQKEKKSLQYKMGKEKTKLIWNDKNSIGFIQLVYALFEAGYISNAQNDVNIMINTLARVFNLPLHKNWQSQFANSIKIKNIEYCPEIFGKMEKAFSQYLFRVKNDHYMKVVRHK